MDITGYDFYRVTARWKGEDVVGMVGFTKGADIATDEAKSQIRASVYLPARKQFGSDVDFEIVSVEFGSPVALPETF